MQILRTLFVSTMLFTTAVPALAQDRSVDVRFPASATGTTISDSVTGRDAVLYKLGAEAGQTMNVVLSSNSTATYFNVFAPGSGLGDAALVIGEFTDPINAWSGTLETSGEYTVAVFLYRAAARRGETADFTLDLSVLGETGARVEGDFADGLAGGPDFFQVSVSGGGTLNMRAGPSAGASVVTRLVNGQNLRNLGCRMAEGGRWCRVATMADPGHEGWAAGDFLIEASGVVADLAVSGPDVSVGDGDERVQFAAGSTGAELRGMLAPGESRRYTINARNGQFLTVRVVTQAAPVSYQILNPDRTFLLDMISTEQDYRGQLWQSGDHVVEVINRTNDDATFAVVIGIE